MSYVRLRPGACEGFTTVKAALAGPFTRLSALALLTALLVLPTTPQSHFCEKDVGGARLRHVNCYQTSEVVVRYLDVGGRRQKRSRASDGGGAKAELGFRAYGIKFDVVLNNHDLFEPEAKLVLHDNLGARELPLDYGELLQGHVRGYPGSSVHGRLSGDTFDGAIRAGNETYYVEPYWKYFAKDAAAASANGSFNTIVYRLSDVDADLYRNATGRCLATRPPAPHSSGWASDGGPRVRLAKRAVGSATTAAVTPSTSSSAAVTASAAGLSSSRRCTLALYADHRYFLNVGGGNLAATIAEMVYHVGEADTIFRGTAWDGGDSGNNVGFVIAQITVYQTASSNPMSGIKDGATAQSYLDAFSLINHERFCTGLAFTYVDFQSGVLGLAWIGSATSPSLAGGGVCQQPFILSNQVVYYNSAIASMKNFGTNVARPMYSITVTHELGHNFGAEHDSLDSYLCTPGGPSGNYIMFPVSGDGTKPNNYVFSECTINSVFPVLRARMSVCFQAKVEEYCGNTVVEGSEMCDCGTATTCNDMDVCCTVWSANSTSNCRLRPNAACTPRVSACCTSDCRVAAATPSVLCQPAKECSNASYCSGTSADCPKQALFPDGTPCSGGARVCVKGDCLKTLCDFKGLEQCFCTDKEHACDVCCRANASAPCQSAVTLGIAGAGSASVKIPANGLCQDGNGMCDIHGSCIPVFGSMAQVDFGMLLQDSANDLASTFKNYWYYVVISACAMIGAIVIFVVVHKKVKPVHSIAYKDGKMARMWFESRMRLEIVNKEIAAAISRNPYLSWPPPVALARISYQFPTLAEKQFYLLAPQCQTESDYVQRLLAMGYPMRALLQPSKWQTTDVTTWVADMFRRVAANRQ